MIRYYSTNRRLDGVAGLTPFKGQVSFRDALIQGQAPDEGLFMPDSIPRLSIDDILALKGAPYAQAALLVAQAFLEGELTRDVLKQVVEDSYNYDVPLERVFDRMFVMRLDRGPTASFKDFAARMMARLMSRLRDRGKRLNVLVATSGDTGSAVGEAFKGVEGISVWILYPRNEVSGMQKKQLDSIGDNVQALSVDGKFDDCQNLVKQAFSDPGFVQLNLTSANSINFGRIMPQSVYYIYAYAQLASKGEEIVFSVPSGNFGNALGCEYARRMGLPVRMLVMPTNENDEFPNYLKTGVYEKVSPSQGLSLQRHECGPPQQPGPLLRSLRGDGGPHRGCARLPRSQGDAQAYLFRQCLRRGDEEDHPARLRTVQHPAGAPRGRWMEGTRALPGGLLRAHRGALCLPRDGPPGQVSRRDHRAARHHARGAPSMKDLDKRTGEPVDLPADYDSLRTFLLDTLKGTD